MSDPARHEARAFPGAKLRAPRGARLMNGLITALVMVVLAAFAAVPDLRTALGVMTLILALPITLALLQFRRNSPRGGGRLEIGDDGVYVQGRLVMPRETLDRAVVVPDERGVTVAIQRKKGFTAVIEVESDEQGRALVEALGLSAAQTLSSFTFDSPVAAKLPAVAFALYLLALLPTLFLPMWSGVAWMSIPLGAAWYAGLLAMSVPAKITVGLDGLLVRWMWRRELIRFADLRAVDHDGERVRLTLADGRVRALSAKWMGEGFARRSAMATGFASRGAYLDAVVARVREAIDASRRPTEHLAAAALLRQGREVDAWVRALRAMLSRGAQGFRDAETVPEQLWSTVEDGGADPAARAAAAIALGPALDDADRGRLRGVARVVVSPRLRVAIEAAADGDDDHVVEALAELEQAQEERRTS